MRVALKSDEILEGGARTYRMSQQAYLTDSDDHNMSHLMTYAPLTDAASWGTDVPNRTHVLRRRIFAPLKMKDTSFDVPR